MSMELKKKADAAEVQKKEAKTDAPSKTKAAVTPGAGFDVQQKELAPGGAKEKKTEAGGSKAEIDEWMAVSANILKIKPEGGAEVQEHLAKGAQLAKSASKAQAAKIQAKMDQIRAMMSSDMVGAG